MAEQLPPEQPSEVPPAEVGGAPPATEGISCKYCTNTFPSLGELGRHMWSPETEGGHKEIMVKLQKEGRVKAGEIRKVEEAKRVDETKPSVGEVEELGRRPTPGAVYKGEPNATGILRDILEKHPDISESIKDEILDWAELRGYIDPQAVAYLLSQMKGVSLQTASIIAQKYSLALQRAQLEGRPDGQMQMFPHFQPQQPQFQIPTQGYPQFPQAAPTPLQPSPYTQPSMYPQQPQPTQPPYSPYQPQPREITREEISAMMSRTRDDFTKAVNEMLKEDKAEREKETLGSILAKSIERQDKLFEKIEKGELFPKFREGAEAPPTKEEIAAMAGKAATDAAAKVVEVKSREDRENQRHRELLSAVRSSAGSQAVSGYKDDSYRFLGQGLSSMASAIQEKQPLKIVLEKAPDVLYGPAGLSKKEIVPGAGEGIIQRLRPEWIAEG